jgi:hypothetical protein
LGVGLGTRVLVGMRVIVAVGVNVSTGVTVAVGVDVLVGVGELVDVGVKVGRTYFTVGMLVGGSPHGGVPGTPHLGGGGGGVKVHIYPPVKGSMQGSLVCAATGVAVNICNRITITVKKTNTLPICKPILKPLFCIFPSMGIL